MLQQLKRISSSTAIYGLGGLTNQIIGFFLIPIYCHVLPVAEYGKLTYFNLLSAAISMLVVLGLVAAMYRYYMRLEEEGRERDLVSTIFFTILIIGGGLAVILISLAPKISFLIFKDYAHSAHIRLTVGSAATLSLNALFFGILRYKERAFQFVSIVVGKTILGMCLNIIAVVVLRVGIIGILTVTLLTELLSFVILLTLCYKFIRFKIDFDLLPTLLRYGVPLIMASIGSYMLNYTGIYFLKESASLEAVGHYGLALKFSHIVMLFVITPFDQAWNPIKFKMLGEPNHKELFARLLDYVLLVAGFLGLGISVLAGDVIRLVAAPSYFPAARIIPFLCLSSILFGAYRVVTIGSEIAEKTHIRSLLVLVVGVFNLSANFLFTPRFQLTSVLTVLILSYTGLFTAMYIYSQRCYHLPYRIRRIAHMISVFALFYIVSGLLSLGIWLNMAVKVVLVGVCVPAVFWFTSFFDKSEQDFILLKTKEIWTRLFSTKRLLL